MNFNFSENNVYINNIKVLSNISLLVNDYLCSIEGVEPNKIIFNNKEHNITAELYMVESKTGITFHINLTIAETFWAVIETLKANNAIKLCFDFENRRSLVSRYMINHYWASVEYDTVKNNSIGIIVNDGSKNLCLLPSIGEIETGWFGQTDNGQIYASVSIGDCGYAAVDCDMFVLSVAPGVYDAIELAQQTIECNSLFETQTLTNKKTPPYLDYFGWCTWNAFYFDVNAEGIKKKLDEFKEKNVPVKWIIIDDGWFDRNDFKILSFTANTAKFPNGLKSFIEEIKLEYGIEYVGIWLDMSSYWDGIDPNSSIYKNEIDDLYTLKNDITIFDFRDENKVYNQYNKIFAYLKESGVDFVKLDDQGGVDRLSENNYPYALACRNMQNAAERAAKDYFDGNIINCMCHGTTHSFNRKYSSVIRNSDDYFPNKDDSFKSHLLQNSYNALFHRRYYICDFDMWWTNKPDSQLSAVLRAISGGAVYISDEVGSTIGELVNPFVLNDKVIRPCGAAELKEDSFYKKSDVFKLLNTTINGASVEAIFNLGEDTTITIDKSDIKNNNNDKYIAYLFYEKKFYLIDDNNSLSLSLGKDSVELINFYPVTDNTIQLGNVNKYLNSACEPKTKNITELQLC